MLHLQADIILIINTGWAISTFNLSMTVLLYPLNFYLLKLAYRHFRIAHSKCYSESAAQMTMIASDFISSSFVSGSSFSTSVEP